MPVLNRTNAPECTNAEADKTSSGRLPLYRPSIETRLYYGKIDKSIFDIYIRVQSSACMPSCAEQKKT